MREARFQDVGAVIAKVHLIFRSLPAIRFTGDDVSAILLQLDDFSVDMLL